ncbi:MAG: hypothetical protein WCH82_14100, partial [Mycobacteriaceae bacterium]
MPPRKGNAASWTAWALVPVLCAGLTAPTASAEGCSGAAAQAQPLPGQDIQIPSPGKIAPLTRPLGHKPIGANDAAPLPNIGQILAQVLNPNAAQAQKAAAVVPAPQPVSPAAPAPVAAAPLPAPAAAVAPSPSNLPPGTSVVGWVTGPDSP